MSDYAQTALTADQTCLGDLMIFFFTQCIGLLFGFSSVLSVVVGKL